MFGFGILIMMFSDVFNVDIFLFWYLIIFIFGYYFLNK